MSSPSSVDDLNTSAERLLGNVVTAAELVGERAEARVHGAIGNVLGALNSMLETAIARAKPPAPPKP